MHRVKPDEAPTHNEEAICRVFSSGVPLGILTTLKDRPWGGVTRNGPHRLMCLNVWNVRSSSPAGVGVALLEEVALWGWALRSQNWLKLGLVWHSLLLPLDQDVELNTSPAPCLLV
ncbi:hypothetical protein I79_025152 [Cricetulus griseus]|uniref:Uncharacterized protein n=1 Tax=Cricetulus griseus TaxID=10029 RepID=G3IML2_CRIGR|nr:hypothetical protein I79_025152 [Cricetulus griseus]